MERPMQQSLLAALAESCYVMLVLSSLGDQLRYPKLCVQLRFALSHESKVLGHARSGVTTLMPLAHSLNVARDCSHAMESDSQSGTYYSKDRKNMQELPCTGISSR